VSLVALLPPNSTALLGLIDVKRELGINSSDYDTLLTDLIAEASDLVYDLLGYSAFRTTRRETLEGNRRTVLVLRARPVLRIDAASYRGSAVTVSEVTIANANAGILSRDAGFDTCADPAEWSFDYLSGWFLTGDDITTTIDVSSSDNSYNSSAAFTRHLVAGDWIAASDFTNAANNGSKRVLTATASKITVEQTLVTESGATRTLGLENVPAALRRAAMTAVRSWYRARTQSGTIASKEVDGVKLSYAQDAASQLASVDRDVARQLGAWRDF
jgi:hypothetical protein